MDSISYYNFLTQKKETLRATDIIGASDLSGHGMFYFLYHSGSFQILLIKSVLMIDRWR